MTSMMSGCFYPTSNMMLVNMVSIVKVFDENRNNQLVSDIIKKMEVKWKKYYESVPYCAIFSHIFDPRFKLRGCEVYLEEYYACLGSKKKLNMKELKDFSENLFSSYCSHQSISSTAATSSSRSSSSSRFSLLDKVKKSKNDSSAASTFELAHYLNNDLVNDSEDFDILHWWKVEEKKFSILSIIARDLLTSQMSSVASESAFSAGARTVTDRRTRLSPKSIKFCMLLKNWLDEEYRLKNLKRLEKYKVPEMNEDEDDEDGEPDIAFTSQDEEPEIERFYFPTTEYYYSSVQEPNFTYDWQRIPD